MSASPDSVFREIRSSDVFANLVTELGDRFHDEDYKDSRIPDIKADFQKQAEEAGVPEDAAAGVAGRLIEALMQEAKDQAPPPPRSKWHRLDPDGGPLPRALEVELPGPMYHLFQLIDTESSPFRQVHRLIDAIEWAVKWHTTLALGDLLAQGDIPKSVKLLLARGLQTPSLGTWHRFFREAVAAFDAVETMPALPWDRFEHLNGLEAKHNLVNFRNKYAHGATPNDDECQRDVEQFLPVLRELVHSPLFTGIRLAVRSEGDAAPHVLRGPKRTSVDVDVPPGHAVALLPDVAERSIIDLWPLGIARLSDADTGPVQKGETQFFFFNALKHNEVDQLNYEGPLHYRDSSLYDPFLQRLPLRAWRQAAGPDLDDVTEQVEALTDTFKGRREERARLRDFVANGEGTLMVFGAPGIGKSTLLAQVVKEVEAGIDADGRPLTGSDGTPIDPPPVIAYFIRRAEGSDDPVTLLRSLCRQLDRCYGVQGIGMGNDSVTLQENLRARLQAIQDQASGTPERTVLLIDGLDEAPDLGRYIPAARGWLPVIVASRETPEAESFYESRHRETRSRMTLGPMGTADVRAMLYDGVSKYDPDFTEAYVEAVTERSEGNPLYLKLLVEALFQGEMTVGDVSALPSEMGTMYRTAVRRVTDEGTNQDAVDLLHLLAEAKAPLPPDALGELLGINSMRADAAVHATKELLREAPTETLYPTSEDAPAEAVQLFHESFRQWLEETHAAGCQAMRDRLAERTAEWDKRQNETARRYALRYGAVHQRTAERPDVLWELLSDPTYRNAQVNAFKQYDATYDAMQHGLDVYAMQNGATPESDVRLARLTLDAGFTAQEAQESVTQAFRWAEAGRMRDALQRIKVLGEEKYFLAILRLLWIEADRQAKRPEAERSTEKALAALDALDDRIASVEAIDWTRFLSSRTITWWTEHVLIALPSLDLAGVLLRTRNRTSIVKALSEQITTRVFREQGMHLSTPREDIPEEHASEELNINVSEAEGILTALTRTARHIVQVIKGNHARTSALTALAVGLAKAGCKTQARSVLDEAYAVAQVIKNNEKRTSALTALAVGLAKAGCKTQAQSVLDEAYAVAQVIKSGWMRALALERIEDALTEEDQGSTTRRDEYNFGHAEALIAIIDASEHTSYDTDAQSVVDGIHTVDCSVSYPRALKNLANALSEVDQFDAAYATAQTIEDNEERSSALRVLAAELEEFGHVDRSKIVFEEARTTAQAIENFYNCSETLTMLATTLTKAGSYTEARSVFEEAYTMAKVAERESMGPHAIATLAKALVEVGHFDKAHAITNTIINNRFRATSLAKLAEEMVRFGHNTKARSVSDDAIATAQAIEDKRRRFSTLQSISFYLAEASQLNYVRAITWLIEDEDTRASSLATYASALAKAGDENQAELAFDEAHVTAHAVKDTTLRDYAVAHLTVALADADRIDKACTTVQAIENDWLRAGPLAALATALAEAGDIKRAVTIVNSIPHLLSRADAIREVISHLHSDLLELLVTYLPSLELAYDDWADVFSTLREGLLEYVADPRSLLRESLTLYPLDQKSAVEGVYALVQGHVQAGDLDTAGAIAAACPELQLDVLVTESERQPLPDDCDPETLPDTFRAKFDALVAAHASGEMDDATFTAKAEVIFEMAAL